MQEKDELLWAPSGWIQKLLVGYVAYVFIDITLLGSHSFTVILETA